MSQKNGSGLPAWFYLVRAIAALVVGCTMLLFEAFGDGVGRIALIGAGLLLLGVAPTDLITTFRRN